MENILNYIKINELISTSGQPKLNSLNKSKWGFWSNKKSCFVWSSNAILNEDKIVTSLGNDIFIFQLIL